MSIDCDNSNLALFSVEELRYAAPKKVCEDFLDKMKKAAEDDRAGYCGIMNRSIWSRFNKIIADTGDYPEVYTLVPTRLVMENGVEDGMMVLFPWRDRNLTFTPKITGNVQIPRGCLKVLDVNEDKVIYDPSLDRKDGLKDEFQPRYQISTTNNLDQMMYGITNGTLGKEKLLFSSADKECFEKLNFYLTLLEVEYKYVQCDTQQPNKPQSEDVLYVGEINLNSSKTLDKYIENNHYSPNTENSYNREMRNVMYCMHEYLKEDTVPYEISVDHWKSVGEIVDYVNYLKLNVETKPVVDENGFHFEVTVTTK